MAVLWYNGNMLVRQGFRFKLKTTPAIERLFRLNAGHARFVWNKALRLNLDRLARGVPIIRYTDLCGYLRLWKASDEYAFLAEAHSQVLQQKLKDLDRAFAGAFDPSQSGKRLPRFKKKGRRDSFRFPQGVRVENRRVFLPKIGWVGLFKSREIPGIIKQATVYEEPDGWYVSIQTERNKPEPEPAVGGMLALDLGVAVFTATSDGELIEGVRAFARLSRKLARLQRKLARQKKGSANAKKTKARIARLHQRIRRIRDDFLHKVSTRLGKSHAIIFAEDLDIRGMTRSAAGTLEKPGRNVKAKSGLNRAILDQAWGTFLRLLRYKLELRGGRLIPVPYGYSSQECSECGHVSAANRPSRDTFRCEACGHAEHADLNAAKVILKRGLRLLEKGESAA